MRRGTERIRLFINNPRIEMRRKSKEEPSQQMPGIWERGCEVTAPDKVGFQFYK